MRNGRGIKIFILSFIKSWNYLNNFILSVPQDPTDNLKNLKLSALLKSRIHDRIHENEDGKNLCKIRVTSNCECVPFRIDVTVPIEMIMTCNLLSLKIYLYRLFIFVRIICYVSITKFYFKDQRLYTIIYFYMKHPLKHPMSSRIFQFKVCNQIIKPFTNKSASNPVNSLENIRSI